MTVLDSSDNLGNRDVTTVLLAALLVLLSGGVAHADDAPLTGDAVPAGSVPRTEPDGPVVLVKEAFPNGEWVFFSGKTDARLEETWRVAMDPQSGEPALICTGDPQGYIRTKSLYTDFELGVEWKYPTDPNGNSGIFLFTSGQDRIWPTALQVQLHQPVAGSAFPSGGAKVDSELRDVPQIAKPVNQWNRCKIRCENGKVTISVNDIRVGEVTGCQPNSGSIALQSEGSEIHFRNFWVRDLNQAAQSAAAENVSHVIVPRIPRRFLRPAFWRRHPELVFALDSACGLESVQAFEQWGQLSAQRIRNPRLLGTDLGSW